MALGPTTAGRGSRIADFPAENPVGLIVLDPGWSTTVQDAGRPGFREWGVPPAGACDHCRNHAGQPCFEMSPGVNDGDFDTRYCLRLVFRTPKPLRPSCGAGFR